MPKKQQWLDVATPKTKPFSTKIGGLSLGQLRGSVASTLAKLGYTVSGYSKNQKNLENIQYFSGDEINAFLRRSQALINLLPLTTKTLDILNQSLFSQLSRRLFN